MHFYNSRIRNAKVLQCISFKNVNTWIGSGTFLGSNSYFNKVYVLGFHMHSHQTWLQWTAAAGNWNQECKYSFFSKWVTNHTKFSLKESTFIVCESKKINCWWNLIGQTTSVEADRNLTFFARPKHQLYVCLYICAWPRVPLAVVFCSRFQGLLNCICPTTFISSPWFNIQVVCFCKICNMYT